MTPLERLTDHVRTLTRPETHRAPWSYRNEHGTLVSGENVVQVVSLIDQLLHTPLLEVTSESADAQHRPAPGSRPAGSLERLDAYEFINTDSRRLLLYTGGKDRKDVAANLHALIGQATLIDEDAQTYLVTCSSLWVSRAMSVTGWSAPSFRPNNTCPLCASSRSLRVRVITAQEVHASCVVCGEVWTPDSIGVLAAHIRWENGEYDELEVTA
jgi:hypothetical protein